MQTWKRGVATSDGWFVLTNPQTQKRLTATSATMNVVEGSIYND